MRLSDTAQVLETYGPGYGVAEHTLRPPLYVASDVLLLDARSLGPVLPHYPYPLVCGYRLAEGESFVATHMRFARRDAWEVRVAVGRPARPPMWLGTAFSHFLHEPRTVLVLKDGDRLAFPPVMDDLALLRVGVGEDTCLRLRPGDAFELAVTNRTDTPLPFLAELVGLRGGSDVRS